MGSKDEKKEVNSTKNNVKPYGKVLLTLKNQLLPDEKLLNTPSKNDGLSAEAETDLRIYGCELIQTAGILLKLPQVAMATGQVLLQRFYYSKSLVLHPIEHIAMACVCLASKIEEAPRRVRDVVNVFTHIRQVNSGKLPKNCTGCATKAPPKHQKLKESLCKLKSMMSVWVSIRGANGSTFFGIFTQYCRYYGWIGALTLLKSRPPMVTIGLPTKDFFGFPRGLQIGKAEHFNSGKITLEVSVVDLIYRSSGRKRPIQPVIPDQNYVQLKSLVIKAERRVLKELGFCVHIKHPHKIIVMYLQVLGFQNNHKLMQYSWNYMNDSLRTDVFVRYQPETVACACIYLTSRKLKLPLPKNPHWYTIFGATEKEIRDICIKILKLYNRPKPNIENLEKQVEALCEKYKETRAKAKGVSGNNSPTNNGQDPQKTSAHNAWGGFISRSGSHMPPPVSEKRSRSRSETRSPEKHHHKKAKKHRSRTRSPSRNHKKSHKRKSYSRSRSKSPHKSRKTRDRKRSRSYSNDRDSKNDRYIDRYDDKYDKDRKYDRDSSKYREERDRDRYDKYEDSRKERDTKKHDRDEKYRDDKHRDEKYSSKDEKYSSKEKKSKHRDRSKSRSKDRRRRS